ncbi:hypothetical protein [Methylobacterium bullatum]|uniref:hypothetical protein n=1 Tax=Methylobacterium bullatum TaxID=570505 RepID=UPI0017868532|nr:hypothetical protein [Methylobacterium bullatum]
MTPLYRALFGIEGDPIDLKRRNYRRQHSTTQPLSGTGLPFYARERAGYRYGSASKHDPHDTRRQVSQKSTGFKILARSGSAPILTALGRDIPSLQR